MKIFTTIFLLSTYTFAGQIYTMQDLKILASQSENIEYLEHAKDIKPTNRNKEWKRITINVAMAFNEQVGKKAATLSQKELELIKKIDKWPLLIKDISYLNSKKVVITKQLNDCIKLKNESLYCLNQAKKNYLSNKDPQLGLDISKILNTSYPMIFKASQLLPFTKAILASNVCEFYINKDPLSQIIINLTKNDLSKFSNLKIDKDCKKALSKDLLEKLYKTNNSITRKSAKTILLKWGLLHSNDIYYYNIAQFLDDYHFNKKKLFVKWKTFKTISKNSATRDLILSKLIAKRPLLGKVLYNDSKESTPIIDALSRTIPEYFTEYAKLCISYFKGEIDAPSADCHQLFKANNKITLFSKSYSNNYIKIVGSWKKE